MISDAELLKLVMDRYPEQPTPFIIEQFTVLKAGLIQANNKLAAMDMEEPVCEQVIIEEPMPEAAEAAPSAAPKKKFTKRSLVVRPEEAIGDDVVQCCLCGRGFQNLTAKHLLCFTSGDIHMNSDGTTTGGSLKALPRRSAEEMIYGMLPTLRSAITSKPSERSDSRQTAQKYIIPPHAMSALRQTAKM